MVEINEEALDEALDQLERAMAYGEIAFTHDEMRPSTVVMAESAREAYQELVEAHPNYELED